MLYNSAKLGCSKFNEYKIYLVLCYSDPVMDIIIIIQYSVWRQVQSLFQNDSSTWCDPKPPLSNESILTCP